MTSAVVQEFDLGSMVAKIHEGKKDPLYIDFARQIGPHYAKMVEAYSKREGTQICVHNNKAIFLEAIDIWCRSTMNSSLKERYGNSGGTPDPRKIIAFVMEPWYEAMELQDPSEFQMGRRPAPPVYTGSAADATACVLALAACLEIYPMSICVGKDKEGRVVGVWGKVKAEGKFYDTDVSNAKLRLGDRQEYASYDEVEVEL